LTAATKGVVVEVKFRDRFRGAQTNSSRDWSKMIAQVALQVGADIEKIEAAKGRQRHRRDRHCGCDRHPSAKNMTLRRAGFARSRQGRGVELCA